MTIHTLQVTLAGQAPLKTRVVRYAQRLGFDLVRVTTADPLTDDAAIARERVLRGHMDGMPWFTEERVQRAARPPGSPSWCQVHHCRGSKLPTT